MDDFFFVEKVDFALCGVDVYIDTLGVNVDAQIDEWVAAFGEECRVCLFNGFFDCSRLYCTVIDEEQDRGLLDVVVGIACPARGFKTPFAVTDVELDKFVCDRASMSLADAVDRTSV